MRPDKRRDEKRYEMPKISVIIGAHNCADTIEVSIKSILDQTFSDWECLICDDASSDSTFDILKSIYGENKKFTILRNERNLGLAASLNRCIKVSNGEFLARQDADDFSYPERFREQLAFLEKNRDVTVVGTYTDLFSQGSVWGSIMPPVEPKLIDWVRGFGIVHGSAMMQRRAVIAAGMYDESAIRSQDYDLWVRMVAFGSKIRTLPKVLYSMRWDRSTYARRKFKFRIAEIKMRLSSMRRLKAPTLFYLYILKPIFIAVVPSFFIRVFHFYKFRNLKV